MSLAARLGVLAAVVAALAAMFSGSAAAQENVTVSLTEFAVAATPPNVPAGDVAFQVNNDGAIIHNLRVIATNLAPDALPITGGSVDEAQVNVVASSADLAGGGSAIVNANLPAGNYVLICNILGHYGAGMFTAFQATGGAQPTNTPAPAATNTPAAAATTAAPTPPAGLSLPATGASSTSDGSNGWWALIALAGAGAAVTGLSAVAYRRSR